MFVSDSDFDARQHQRSVSDGLHLRVFEADVVRLAKGHWNSQNVQSTFWRFYQNQDAGAYLTLADGNRFSLAPHRLYFIPAGVRFSCGNDADVAHFYLHFDAVGLPRLALRALWSEPVVLEDDAQFMGQVADFARYVAAAPSLDLAGQCRSKALLYEGIAQYLASAPDDKRAQASREAAALEPVAPTLLYIESHLAEPLPLAQLAALCCFGTDHFARRFKGCVGQSPVAYIQERRITHAAQLLLFTDRSVEQIAESCGFGSRFYFTRVFTRVLGIAPVAYRRQGTRT